MESVLLLVWYDRRPAEAQPSAREGPRCSLQSRLRRQLFSVGAQDPARKLPLHVQLVCPFIDFWYSFLPFFPSFPSFLHFLSSPELTFLPVITWETLAPSQKGQLAIIIPFVELVLLRNEGAET
jgi:hypothetical protein